MHAYTRQTYIHTDSCYLRHFLPLPNRPCHNQYYTKYLKKTTKKIFLYKKNSISSLSTERTRQLKAKVPWFYKCSLHTATIAMLDVMAGI